MLANNKAVAAVNVTPPIIVIILPTKVIFYMLVATTDSVLFVLSINIKKSVVGVYMSLITTLIKRVLYRSRLYISSPKCRLQNFGEVLVTEARNIGFFAEELSSTSFLPKEDRKKSSLFFEIFIIAETLTLRRSSKNIDEWVILWVWMRDQSNTPTYILVRRLVFLE